MYHSLIGLMQYAVNNELMNLFFPKAMKTFIHLPIFPPTYTVKICNKRPGIQHVILQTLKGILKVTNDDDIILQDKKMMIMKQRAYNQMDLDLRKSMPVFKNHSATFIPER